MGDRSNMDARWILDWLLAREATDGSVPLTTAEVKTLAAMAGRMWDDLLESP